MKCFQIDVMATILGYWRKKDFYQFMIVTCHILNFISVRQDLEELTVKCFLFNSLNNPLISGSFIR